MNHIAEFQKKNGLNDDGVLGKVTIAKMRSIFCIKSEAQMAHFLANIHHETGGFKADTENLNYSAAALANTWPNRYKDTATGKPNALAGQLDNQPQKIANNVYADRMGNGSETSGDGWKYRGRGSLQLTGKNNYILFSRFIKDPEIMLDPDIVAKKYFWESALFYFTTNKLWSKMKGTSSTDVKAIRKAINGGYIGLEDVQAKFTYYLDLIAKK
jgi:putative chitinase